MRLASLTMLIVCAATGGVLGQSQVVPLANATVEGPSLGFCPGAAGRSKLQILIAGASLATSIGKTLVGFELRRDGDYDKPLSGMAMDAVVTISTTSVRPEAAFASFTANHGAGKVALPAARVSVPLSPAVGSDRWSADQTIHFQIAPGFLYLGGTLCLEIEATPAPGAGATFWPVDCARQPIDSAVTQLGEHCAGFFEDRTVKTLKAEPESLVIGATLRFSGYGRPLTPGALLLGPGLGATAQDLTSLGMTGCVLRVQPLLQLAVVFDQILVERIPTTGFPATAYARVEMPCDTAFLGAYIAAQLANLESGAERSNPLGVTLSQGIGMKLASTPITLGMSMVESRTVPTSAPLPDTGAVIPNRAPVLRLLYQ